jgi:uncharacterized protein
VLSMLEKEISIKAGNPIFGTLTIPSENGRFPAVLLLPGSGPIDRDGNDRKGKFQTNLYKDLARFIAKLGFVTFRFDKRGTGKRDGEWLATGLTDLLEDAKEAMNYLKSVPFIDQERIIVCGHSEGTIHATHLAATMNPAGVMLLAGGVDNLIEALKKQRQLAYQELYSQPGFKGWLNRKLKVDVKGEKQTEALMDKMIKSDKDVIKFQLFFKQPAKYFREHSAFNTRETLKNVTCPVFTLQGDKDTLVDNEVLKELPHLVKGECEIHVVPNMEHSLRTQTEEKSILKHQKVFKEVLKRPFNEEALGLISSWLVSHFAPDPNRS